MSWHLVPPLRADENLKGRKLEDESTDKRLQEYKDAIFSTPPRVPVDDPLVGIGFSTPTYLDAMYKVANNNQCPAFQNDFQYIVESYQMIVQGYDKFFHSRQFDNGAVFGPGQCTTSYIGQDNIRKVSMEGVQCIENGHCYRENSLGHLRLNSEIFSRGVWSDGYKGISLGASKEDHDVIRPVVDLLFNGKDEWERDEWETFSDKGNIWKKSEFISSAKRYFGLGSPFVPRDTVRPSSVDLGSDPGAVSMDALEQLYPQINQLLEQLARDAVRNALVMLTRRFEQMRRIVTERSDTRMLSEMDENLVQLDSVMDGIGSIQTIASLGPIGNINVAKELVTIVYRVLEGIKTAIGTMYSFGILLGGTFRPSIPVGWNRPDMNVVLQPIMTSPGYWVPGDFGSIRGGSVLLEEMPMTPRESGLFICDKGIVQFIVEGPVPIRVVTHSDKWMLPYSGLWIWTDVISGSTGLLTEIPPSPPRSGKWTLESGQELYWVPSGENGGGVWVPSSKPNVCNVKDKGIWLNYDSEDFFYVDKISQEPLNAGVFVPESCTSGFAFDEGVFCPLDIVAPDSASNVQEFVVVDDPIDIASEQALSLNQMMNRPPSFMRWIDLPHLQEIRDEILQGDVRNLRRIVMAGHAIADAFLFAGGLSVPAMIKHTVGAFFDEDEEQELERRRLTSTDMKLLILETTRRFPPVLGFTFIDKESGQRIAPLPGMGGYDRNFYGEDIEKIRIRGGLDFYHSRSLNWNEAATVSGNGKRVCPGRSMSLAMAAAFIEALGGLENYCLAPGNSIVYDDSGPSFMNSFSITTWCPEVMPGSPTPAPSNLPSLIPSESPSNMPSEFRLLRDNGEWANCDWLNCSSEDDQMHTKSAKSSKERKRKKKYCPRLYINEGCPDECAGFKVDGEKSPSSKGKGGGPAAPSPTPPSGVEDNVGPIRVLKYPVEDVLDLMNTPVDTVPAHLQYIIGLDQSGAVALDSGLPFADPEYAVNLSGGEWTDATTQSINRCYGGDWSLLFFGEDNDIDRRRANENEKFLKYTNSGEGFLNGISETDERCKFASAMSDEDDNTMQDLDALCCPPKPGKDSCLGENKLGDRGCETISDVCGPVLAENVSTCAMFKRSNTICIGVICDVSNYLVYPLADKNGKPTSYNDHYFSAIKDLRKVKTVFHGIERIQD
ncbi:predicted protein [Chaetoceros tenuissimus]|uniref:Uncharacterized protein n=1 Tax=Chaetoceros tenuissimus TaxID=426638 RepID=A0AAD3D308_9STRA|nr:predicted protein [Chaetoceros tenuissimus]